MWRSQHEMVCAFKYGEAANVNNIKLGVFGRHRSNVLQYPGMNTPGRGRGKALDLHATVKPVALIADLMLDVSNRHDIVLDPFGGSGTAIVAAEKVDRIAYLAEIAPRLRRCRDPPLGSFERHAGAPCRHRPNLCRSRHRAPAGEAGRARMSDDEKPIDDTSDDREPIGEGASDGAAPVEGSGAGDYKVGYGRPPQHGKIKKGEVRNPRGKRRGKRSFKAEMAEVLEMRVPMTKGGKTVSDQHPPCVDPETGRQSHQGRPSRDRAHPRICASDRGRRGQPHDYGYSVCRR